MVLQSSVYGLQMVFKQADLDIHNFFRNAISWFHQDVGDNDCYLMVWVV